MGETTTLEATAREGTGKGAARSARRNGLVPGVIYGGGEAPQAINMKFNELLKLLKKGKFMSSLHNVRVDGVDNRVVCKAVQRDVVKDLPTHVDFLRLTESSRIKLHVPVEFLNVETCPGIKRGGTLNVTRHDVELWVRAGAIPDHIELDLAEGKLGEVFKISAISLPAGVTPVIADRDFVIASIATPSGMVADEEEAAAEA
ncbi:MAG: 50S ribosomal protein L25/general stress protein Ctc [Rubrimonas sp.]|uniref:50S ribosomal protein L25/general stress protein Ctc n=1 Tax=Rubrimonas sp. TaxID=2036015 RepID=UPI002FDE8C45